MDVVERSCREMLSDVAVNPLAQRLIDLMCTDPGWRRVYVMSSAGTGRYRCIRVDYLHMEMNLCTDVVYIGHRMYSYIGLRRCSDVECVSRALRELLGYESAIRTDGDAVVIRVLGYANDEPSYLVICDGRYSIVPERHLNDIISRCNEKKFLGSRSLREDFEKIVRHFRAMRELKIISDDDYERILSALGLALLSA